MNRRRLSIALAIAALSLALVVPQAGAWEFSMSGSFGWELEFVGQDGRSGFFGPYDVDAGSGVLAAGTFAPYNLWVGQPAYRMVSGSDASWQTQYLTTNMQVRMNKALRIRGQYYLGEWSPPTNAATGILPASEYLNSRFPGIQQSFSPGYWNTLWLSAQLPWGTLSLGKRPSTWGMGLGWNGDFTRSSESFSLTAPMGPFRFGLSFYPSRNASTADYYNPDYDKNNKRLWDTTLPNMTFRSGMIDLGIQGTFVNTHRGGEGRIPTAAQNRNTSWTYRDRADFYGGIYLKYYTGMVFFNAEMDWYHRTDRNRQQTAAGAPAAGVRDTYIEHYRAASELSVVAGPAKLALFYAWSSGGDRRNGSQIDRDGILRSDSFSNTGLFRPYSYLQVYSYGLGNFVDGTTGYGYAEDMSAYGARLDYCVAANLNVYGTFFWADRASNSGFGWGAIYPDATESDGTVVLGRGPTGAPSIPDSNLGWEVDLGLDWKLIEGLNVFTTFAYWQPGDWYKFACRDKTVTNWGLANPGAASNWGINPDRSIDPIWGIRIIVSGEF